MTEIDAKWLAEMDPQYDVLTSTDHRHLATSLNDMAAEGWIPLSMQMFLTSAVGEGKVMTVVVLVRPKPQHATSGAEKPQEARSRFDGYPSPRAATRAREGVDDNSVGTVEVGTDPVWRIRWNIYKTRRLPHETFHEFQVRIWNNILKDGADSLVSDTGTRVLASVPDQTPTAAEREYHARRSVHAMLAEPGDFNKFQLETYGNVIVPPQGTEDQQAD
jgi:hypothetical protein